MIRLLPIRLLLCFSLVAAPPAALAQSAAPPAGSPAAAAPAPAAPAPAAEIAPASADPIATVKNFYPPRGDFKDWPFSARLRKLLETADANSKRIQAPVAGLDFGFEVNAQEKETGYEKTLKFSPRRSDGKRTRVRVSLRNFRPVELAYDMIFENGRWVVDDVRSIREPRWVLSRLYINGAREK